MEYYKNYMSDAVVRVDNDGKRCVKCYDNFEITWTFGRHGEIHPINEPIPELGYFPG